MKPSRSETRTSSTGTCELEKQSLITVIPICSHPNIRRRPRSPLACSPAGSLPAPTSPELERAPRLLILRSASCQLSLSFTASSQSWYETCASTALTRSVYPIPGSIAPSRCGTSVASKLMSKGSTTDRSDSSRGVASRLVPVGACTNISACSKLQLWSRAPAPPSTPSSRMVLCSTPFALCSVAPCSTNEIRGCRISIETFVAVSAPRPIRSGDLNSSDCRSSDARVGVFGMDPELGSR
mmetsp:Transcript_34265/g.81731  ORF Transcript_34265/g.81731 Transcript_34265/m.81731 type:complete len:240 (-) Transcript_34265:125-844(-)